ncbi:MAG TPA: hypothetical protein PJ982_19600, partial [Lacipirellulaceae bacterium]|nr:hypothetical protein [Lacipirellulaceae bacterium]
MPVVAEAGVGYSLLRGYHLPPVNFTAEEAGALVTRGLLAGRFTDGPLDAQMRSALLKVRAVLPRAQQDGLTRLERAMATTAHAAPPVQADLGLLQRAIAERRLLGFRYQ